MVLTFANARIGLPGLAFLAILTPSMLQSAVVRAQDSRSVPPSETTESIDGILKNGQVRDYVFRARAGQVLNVFASSKLANRLTFRVISPGGDGADVLKSDARSDLKGAAVLPLNGDYTLRLGIRKAAARQGGNVDYNVLIKLTNPALSQGERTHGAERGFRKTLTLNGITFNISAPNEGSRTRLKINPSGIKGADKSIEQDVDGSIYGADVADLNQDNFPEIYVYATSAGSGGYGSLKAYSSNKNISITEIFLPEITEDQKLGKGYMGHDKFSVVEGKLIRSFPIYKASDANAHPTGGTRQIQYSLMPGEAGWVLRVNKVTEF